MSGSESEVGHQDGATEREIAHACTAAAILEGEVAVAGGYVDPACRGVAEATVDLPCEWHTATTGIKIERQIKLAVRNVDAPCDAANAVERHRQLKPRGTLLLKF